MREPTRAREPTRERSGASEGGNARVNHRSRLERSLRSRQYQKVRIVFASRVGGGRMTFIAGAAGASASPSTGGFGVSAGNGARSTRLEGNHRLSKRSKDAPKDAPKVASALESFAAPPATATATPIAAAAAARRTDDAVDRPFPLRALEATRGGSAASRAVATVASDGRSSRPFFSAASLVSVAPLASRPRPRNRPASPAAASFLGGGLNTGDHAVSANISSSSSSVAAATRVGDGDGDEHEHAAEAHARSASSNDRSLDGSGDGG